MRMCENSTVFAYTFQKIISRQKIHVPPQLSSSTTGHCTHLQEKKEAFYYTETNFYWKIYISTRTTLLYVSFYDYLFINNIDKWGRGISIYKQKVVLVTCLLR